MRVTPRTVFLSYTSELGRYPRRSRSYAGAAREAIQSSECALKDMNYLRAGARPPAEVCVDEVLKSDLLVVIVGVRYGETVPGEDDRYSYVELEFEAATRAGLPRLVFMLDQRAELRIPRSERNTDDEESRLQRFRERLMSQSGVTVKTVSDRLRLQHEVTQALADEFVRNPVLPKEFERHSQTQRTQAGDLLSMVEIRQDATVLDAGCGTGRLGMEVVGRYGVKRVHGIDRNPSMIHAARDLATEAGLAGVLQFEPRDILEYTPSENFNVVVSNNTMHWIKSGSAGSAYRRLHDVLCPGTGILAVHQGGNGTYKGLTACAREVVRELGLKDRFTGWSYPLFYPSVDQLRSLLKHVGFVQLTVKSVETDGKEYKTLVEDYAHAGLIPFLKQIESPGAQKRFRDAFLERAATTQPDTSAHNLYVVAKRR